MGAVYGMTRKWYKAIGEPFTILEEWGGDEELMAICGWLCGGQTYLLDCLCGHVYAAPAKGRQIHPAGRWANRLACVRCLPDEGVRQDIELWMKHTRVAWNVIRGVYQGREQRVEKLCKHLLRQRRTWKGLVKKLVRPWEMPDMRPMQEPAKKKQTTQRRLPPAPKDDTTQIVIRKAEVCQRCDSINTFRQVAGIRAMAAGGLIWARCSRCGHKAQIRVV